MQSSLLINTGIQIVKFLTFFPCTDPASQNNTSSSAFSFKTSNPCVNDENNALIATPANVNLRGVVPSFPKELEANTSTAATAAPKKGNPRES